MERKERRKRSEKKRRMEKESANGLIENREEERVEKKSSLKAARGNLNELKINERAKSARTPKQYKIVARFFGILDANADQVRGRVSLFHDQKEEWYDESEWYEHRDHL